MAKQKLTDGEAKAILLKWPGRTNSHWPSPTGAGFWVRAQPRSGKAPGPILHAPGAELFTTQPDGLWAFCSGQNYCDVVAIEVCGTPQNLNDKRSRYFPSSHSLVATFSLKWMEEVTKIQGGGERKRWEAMGTFSVAPVTDIQVPVRHLRVLYALPNLEYNKWARNHTPTGYEYFIPHSSLDTYNSQKMQRFLAQMSISNQFYLRP